MNLERFDIRGKYFFKEGAGLGHLEKDGVFCKPVGNFGRKKGRRWGNSKIYVGVSKKMETHAGEESH